MDNVQSRPSIRSAAFFHSTLGPGPSAKGQDGAQSKPCFLALKYFLIYREVAPLAKFASAFSILEITSSHFDTLCRFAMNRGSL